jgi:hypothetical protein
MRFTEERTSMSGESKTKAGLPDKKVMGFFCFKIPPGPDRAS